MQKHDAFACQTNVPTVTKAGRYELREELGRGAMGVVYHAHDPMIGREVAVKTMHLSEAGTGMSREELVGRFQTEARAAGLLTHPNIVVIYDAGEEEGLFYITMERVEGRSLQAMLDARQLFPLPRVMKMMEQICSALDFAHQHGVVHRDIKPANLMLTADDTVKITDFGTAKILQFGTAQTVHVMGTPSYMSPEQVKGNPVDGRSDIFSLGVILYELMTGEKPFPGQNITTVIYKIINEDPIPPRSLDSSIHPGLSAVISRALAKDPAARFQNCRALLDALKNYHEMVSPEQTVRSLPPMSAPTPAGAVRGSALSKRQMAAPLTGYSTSRPSEAEEPLRPVPAATWEQEESAKKRGSLLLSLILLPIIGYAGYRIYPPMVDVWQLAHQSSETPAAVPKATSAAPAMNVNVPDAKTDAKPDAEAGVEISGQKQPSEQSTAAAPAVEQIEPETVPATVNVHKPIALRKSAVPTSTLVSKAFESKLLSDLQGLSLADKVKIQITANALTLSGKLTLIEHRELLNLLHAVPAGVRVIDDIEYEDDAK